MFCLPLPWTVGEKETAIVADSGDTADAAEKPDLWLVCCEHYAPYVG